MARGSVQLTISMAGRDDLSNKIKAVQGAMEGFAQDGKEAVEAQSGAWATLRGEIAGLPGRLTDVRSAIDLAAGAARQMWEFLDGASSTAAISDVFVQNFENAEEVLQRLSEAVQGSVSESEVMRMANRMAKVGVAAESMAEFMHAGFINAAATGQDLEDAIDNLAESASEGTDSFSEYSGLAIDFAAALDKASASTGKAVDAMTELERRNIRTAAAAEELNKKFGGMQLSEAAIATKRLSASYDDLADSVADATLSLFGFNRARQQSAKSAEELAILEAVYRERNIGDLSVSLSTAYNLTAEQNRKLEAELRKHLDTELDLRAEAAAMVIQQAQRANANLARLQKEDHDQQVAEIQKQIDTELEIELSRLEAEDKAAEEAAARAKQREEQRKSEARAAARAAAQERKAAFERQTQEMLAEIGREHERSKERYERELETQREAIRQEMTLMDLRVSLREASGEQLTAIEKAQLDRDRELLQIRLDAIGEVKNAEIDGLRAQIADARLVTAERDVIHEKRIAQLESEAEAIRGIGTAFSDSANLASQIAPQMGAAFSALSESVGLIASSWGDMSKGAPGVIASLGKVTQSVIKNTTAQAAVRSVFELAAGFASLFLNPAEAAAHFTAAGLYATLAGVSAAAGNTASGPQTAGAPTTQAGSSFLQSGTGGSAQVSNITYVIQGQLHGSLEDASAQTRRMAQRAAGFGYEGAFA